MSKRNPYRRAERIIKKTFSVIGWTLAGLYVAGMFIGWPILGIILGDNIFMILAPWLIVAGVVTFVALMCGAMWLAERFIVRPWRSAELKWERENR